jgi:hypothetical protein
MERDGGEEELKGRSSSRRGDGQGLELNNCYLVICKKSNGSGGRSAWRRLVLGAEGL